MVEDWRLHRRAPVAHTDDVAPPPEAHHHSKVTLTYKLRLTDLYWMWETSSAGLAATAVLAAFGLMFLAVPIAPAGAPIAEDVVVGFVLLLAAPFFPSLVMLFASGKVTMVGRTVELRIDRDGLQGWPVARFRDTSWRELRHPRLESRVLVLPFSWPFADAWAVVPARAFTPAQFETLLAVLREHGFFLDGDHQSPMGRLLSLVADHVPFGDHGSGDGQLVRFPRLVV